MPWAPKDFSFMGPDIAELVAVMFTLVITIAVLVVLGRWWAR